MNTKHLTYLDSLRGVAALIVVFTHLGISNLNKPLFSSVPGHLLVAGSAAVCLFFVLSGYVLSYKFLGEQDSKLKVVEAMIKRPFRLVGVVLFATYLILINYRNVAFNHLGSFIYGSLLHPFTYGVKYNGPLWTINIELIGSFLVFGTVLLIGSIKKELRLAIMLGMMICFYNSFYCAFMFGIIVADLSKNWSVAWFIKHKNVISWIIFIPALVLFSYPQKSNANDWFKTNILNIEYGFVMIGAMLMFITVCTNAFIQKLLHYNRFVFLGKVSYSMYAIHVPIISFINGRVIGRFLCQYLETSVTLSCIIALPTIFLTAWLVDRYVDKPCIKLSGKIAKAFMPYVQSGWVYLKSKITIPLNDSLDPDFKS